MKHGAFRRAGTAGGELDLAGIARVDLRKLAVHRRGGEERGPALERYGLPQLRQLRSQLRDQLGQRRTTKLGREEHARRVRGTEDVRQIATPEGRRDRNQDHPSERSPELQQQELGKVGHARRDVLAGRKALEQPMRHAL